MTEIKTPAHQRSHALNLPELLPYLPFIYTVWADGELTDEELAAVTTNLPDLSNEATKAATAWLDAKQPPTAFELATLLASMKRLLPKESILSPSLANIGQSLVKQPVSKATQERLVKLEGILGKGPAASDLTAPFKRPTHKATNKSDLSSIAKLLNEPHSSSRDAIRGFLSKYPPMPTFHLEVPAQRQHIRERLEALAETGFPKLAYDNLGEFLAGFDLLAHGDLSLWVKSGVQFGLFGGAIHALGTESHHELLKEIAAARLLGAFAMTERAHGSNVMGLETTATYHHDQRCIEIHTPHDGARKEYIGNAAMDGTMAVVFAQLSVKDTPLGVHAVLVPIRDDNGTALPGVKIGDCGPKMGLDGVDNGRLWFDRVRVPVDNLLNRFGSIDEQGEYTSPIASPTRRFFTMLSTLVRGRVSVAAAGLAAAKTGLTIAISYSNQRRQFGPAGHQEQLLLDYPSQQKRLLPRLAHAYAMHFAMVDLRALCASDSHSTELETLAAGLKSYITRYTTDTLQACRESCGGAAYLSSSRLPALRSDTDVFTTFEGDNTVLWQLVAKHLLSDFKSQFGESRFIGIAKYVAERAKIKLEQKNPAITRRTDDSHLLDPTTPGNALKYRADELLHTLGKRLQHRIKSGADSFCAFTEVQSHAIAAAHAHVEYTIWLSFSAAVERFPKNDDAYPVLEKLLALYSLERVHRDRGWFLENEYFEPVKARAIRKMVSQLTKEIRPFSSQLVEAFQIPDSCLGPKESLLRDQTT